MGNDKITPAIVIAAYKRPEALIRLLGSLAKADYSSYADIPLLISIDGEGSGSVHETAVNFKWNYGKKEIVKHDSNLGLRDHILSCGDLTGKFGRVIILEDDLVVSPAFYDYACRAGEFYEDDDSIAGIGLYSPNYREYTQTYFFPVDDAYDNYFLKSAISSGQMWSEKQWQGFRKWYEQDPEITDEEKMIIPAQVFTWPASSWKKHFIRYMCAKDKYFVCPRVSLTTNMGDPGEHFNITERNIQVPLQTVSRDYRFSAFQQSGAVYDQYYEPDQITFKKLAPELEEYDFECDLAGIKELKSVRSNYLLSIKSCRNPVFSFGMELIPMESNVINKLEGTDIAFGKTTDFSDKVNPKKKLKEYLLLHKVFSVRFFREILPPLVREGVKSKLKK